MIIVLLPLLLTVVCVWFTARSLRGSGPAQTHQKSKTVRRSEKDYPFVLTLRLSGLSDTGIEPLRSALEAQDGVWADQIDLQAGTVHLRCKSAPDRAALRTAAAGAGCVVLGMEQET